MAKSHSCLYLYVSYPLSTLGEATGWPSLTAHPWRETSCKYSETLPRLNPGPHPTLDPPIIVRHSFTWRLHDSQFKDMPASRLTARVSECFFRTSLAVSNTMKWRLRRLTRRHVTMPRIHLYEFMTLLLLIIWQLNAHMDHFVGDTI